MFRDTDYQPKYTPEQLATAGQKGEQDGLQAVESPELQEIEKAIKRLRVPTPETDFLSEKYSYRRGYVKGLEGFLTAHQIQMTLLEHGLYTDPASLLDDNVLIGYLSGLRLKKPGLERNFMRLDSIKDKFLNEKIEIRNPDPYKGMTDTFRTSLAQRNGGYTLGFVVRISRDFGVVLQGSDIPADDPAFTAFITGFRGETRYIPALRFKKEDILLNTRGYSWDIAAQADERKYQMGLKLWLQSLGINPMEVMTLRDPKCLEALKAGLHGLPNPGGVPGIIDSLRTDETIRILPFIYAEKDMEKIPKIESKEKRQLEINPDRFWIRRAYNLGKQTREAE